MQLRDRVALIGALAVAVSAALLGAAAPSWAGSLGAPFATLNGTCPKGSATNARGPIVAEDHPDVIARLSASGGPGLWRPNGDRWFSDGDVVFESRAPVRRNQSPVHYVECRDATQNVAFTIELYDRPTAPITFDGRISPRANGNFSSPTALHARAPGAATYVADITFTEGAVRVCRDYGAACHTLASPGTTSLGLVEAGPFALLLEPLEGPPVDYAVTLRPLPVNVNNLRFGGPFSRSGAILKASYSTDGDTTVTGDIVDRGGQLVRNLGRDLTANRGPHTLTWDGLAPGGLPLPDGPYTLIVNSRDPSGQSTSASTTVTLDSAPPVASIVDPRTPTAPATVVFSDAVSGVAQGEVTFGAQSFQYRRGDQAEVLIPAPAEGWTTEATRTLSLQATDLAGNVFAREYVVPAIPAGQAKRVRTRLGTPCLPPTVKPRAWAVDCKTSIRRTRWRSWGAKKATGRARAVFTPCVQAPCSSNRSFRRRVRLTASRRRRCRNDRGVEFNLYTRLKISYVGRTIPAYGGRPRVRRSFTVRTTCSDFAGSVLPPA